MIGSVGIAIPIVLHFMMRQKPKRLPFPAIRFLVPSHAKNRRDFRVRHWLLLALRCVLIAVLALAFARPTLKPDLASRGLLLGSMGGLWLLLIAASVLAVLRNVGSLVISLLMGITGLWTLLLLIMTLGMLRVGTLQTADQEAPVAAVFLLDLSPRMDYLHDGQSRLDLAKSSMRKLLKQLPPGSEVAILTTLDSSAMFTASPQELEGQLTHLKSGFVSRSLSDSLPLAREILSAKTQERLELYIFSDLTQTAWNGETQPETETPDNPTAKGNSVNEARNQPLESDADTKISTYLVDVGVPNATNIQIADLSLSSALVAVASPIDLTVEVEAEGRVPFEDVRLELLLEKPDSSRPVVMDGKALLPELVLRDSASIKLASSNGKSVIQRFRLTGLEPGTHHGRVRLVSQDGLLCDNERYFTFEVGPPWRVLVIPGPGAEGTFLTDALAPYASKALGKARFQCELGTVDRLETSNLGEYSAIALLDPPPLQATQWQNLKDYVTEGHGLGIFLGRNATPVESFQESVPLELLPGKLTRQWRSGGTPLYLAPRAFEHPILAPFRELQDSIPWEDFPIDRHWVFTDIVSSANPVLRFGNDLPALWERRVGLGRVITMATPISDALNIAGRPPWNRLPTGPDPWPHFVLMNTTMSALCGKGDERRNYFVGEQPQVRVADGTGGTKARVFTPAGTWQAVAIADDRSLSLALLDIPGAYRVRTQDTGAGTTGFSANLPAGITRLQRLEFKEMVPGFLPNGSHYVADPDKLERAISEARVGRDVFPWLILAAALIFATENILANRFYPSSSESTSRDKIPTSGRGESTRKAVAV
jgi:Aerotolerance regulator N-terminal